MFLLMFLPPLVEDATWCGPAVATFLVQFPGDPYDPKRNDVKVVFLGDKSQREERPAFFDPDFGGWRAILTTRLPGRYRPKLVRNGKDVQTEDEEGIVDLSVDGGARVVVASGPRPDRLTTDAGASWTGIGADLRTGATRAKIDALADAGANWVRIAVASDSLDDDALAAFDDVMDAVGRRGLSYTLALPPNPSAVWRRYAVARFGNAPGLVQWEGTIDDPWKRASVSTAAPWPALFENRPGPFIVREGDASRARSLRTVVERSGWADWTAPRVWKGEGAKGVADGDRLILVAEPGSKLVGLPLADGTYDVTTVDPATGGATTESMPISRGLLSVPLSGERFFVVRKR